MEQFTVREYIVREIGFPGVLKQEIVGEIVRCEECKHWDEEFEECDHPKVGRRVQVPAGFYCGWGERRTDNDRNG